MYIEQWVATEASALVQGMILSVDRTCQPVVIDSFDDPECASSVTQPPTEGAKSSTSTGVIVFIGGAVGGVVVVVTLIVIVIIIVVVAVRRRNRRAKHRIQPGW